ncbi:hypothetical protein HYE82_33060 [Streptomyces sp. BR123]|uniref:hypothetical protein n=1 Tax=Streptomyces sp. BR123 TaxID=2749828 RepID=UPI0015C41954|nr:hypothetical protein [Streptomyces sp. BR123]NXY99126.1 hypothetical protein [Streptomyces sp. BR123]
MLDTSPLTAAVERFADRLRAMPQSRLQQGAAAEALRLARELSARAQRLEEPHRTAPVREIPDAGLFVVGDQVAVAGLDLAEALRAADAEAAATAGAGEGRETATAPSGILDEAVRMVEQAEVRATR